MRTFAQLHALAKAASDDTDRYRYFRAMASVRDPQLADQVLRIAVSSEIPPQLVSLRVTMVDDVARFHPKAAWPVMRDRYDALVADLGPEAPGFLGQSIPEIFRHAAPLATIEAFLLRKIPADLHSFIDKGMGTRGRR